MRILLIEDDQILAARLVESLTSQNYVVDAIADGQLGLEYAQSTPYDLILTDVGLPGLSGIELCQRLRSAGYAMPILLMTARDAPEERVRGLDAGADDHLTKPLDLEELHARIRALRRRGEVATTTVLTAGPLQLDPNRCQVTYAGQLLKLTPKEYNLLELFLRNPARVFSRGQIIEHLWNFDDPPLEESVKAHIKGLRRKLKQVDSLDWIENVYGLGYRLNPAVLSAELESQSSLSAIAELPAPKAAIAASESNFRQAMDSLWQQHQGLMAERLGCLQAAAQAIPAGSLTAELRQAAAQAAHKLAGVLGMFESAQGTAIARQLEELLELHDPAADQQVPALVSQLSQLMAWPSGPVPEASRGPAAAPAAPLSLLLVAVEDDLSLALQALAAAAGMSCASAASLTEATAIAQHITPEQLVLAIPSAGQKEPSLAFLRSLAASALPPAAIALAPSEGLVDRVAIAQSGVQRLLVQPVSALQVWQSLQSLQQRDQLARSRVLVVDDDPLILAGLRPLLEPWGLQVVGLESPQRFWQVLSSVAPDLLILDVEMPQFSGIDLCQTVRTDPQWQSLPIVFLTAYTDTDTVQRVFTAGADDFVAKPIIGPELVTRIVHRLERHRLLQALAVRDPLTGLLNYSQSRRQLEVQLARAEQAQLPLAVVLLKLVDLAQIQQRYGHEASHQILQYWSLQLQPLLGQGDVAGYWGSGELMIGLLGLTRHEAAAHLAPLSQRLRQHILALPAGDRIQPEYVLKIAQYRQHGSDLLTLYRWLVIEAESPLLAISEASSIP